MDRRLLIPDRLNRVELRGLLGGIPTKEDSGRGTDNERKQHAPRLDEDGKMRDGIHRQRRAHTKHHADQPSRDAD